MWFFNKHNSKLLPETHHCYFTLVQSMRQVDGLFTVESIPFFTLNHFTVGTTPTEQLDHKKVLEFFCVYQAGSATPKLFNLF